MENPYDKLARFKNRKISKLQSMGNDSKNLPQIFDSIRTGEEGSMLRSGIPSSTIFSGSKTREMESANLLSKVMQPRQQESEMRLLDEQESLVSIEAKQEAWDTEQKRIKDEKKKSKDKMLVKLGFTAAGIALAPFTGGASIPIAAGVGDIAAGTGVGTGDFMGEDTIDESLIAQGLANTVTSVISTSKTNAQRGVGTAYSENVKNIMGLSDEGIRQLRFSIDSALLSGDFKGAAEAIRNFEYMNFPRKIPANESQLF